MASWIQLNITQGWNQMFELNSWKLAFLRPQNIVEKCYNKEEKKKIQGFTQFYLII